MRRIVAWSVAFLCLAMPSFAQKVKTVSGSYIYVVPETQSYAEAKETAITRAKIQILADTYGTVMDASTATSLSGNGTQLHALSQSNVKGEWLETVGEPALTRLFSEDQLAIRVEITGKVREIVYASTEFTAKVLCGAPDPRFEGDNFKSGDDMFLFFQAPGDGYLAVYLYDGADDVYCLLPYQRQGNGIFQVKGNQSYIFFSADVSDGQTPYDLVDEYTLTATSDIEMNRVYIVYSPNRFTKALDNLISADLPRELSFGNFQKWLSRIRAEDSSIGVKSVDITISSK